MDFFSRNNYYPPEAYNNSKLAQVLFTKQLQKILTEEQSHVQIHAVHPGVVDTELFNQTGNSLIPWFNRIFFKVTSVFNNTIERQIYSNFKLFSQFQTVDEGSRSIIHAAISPKLEGKGGSYISNCTLVRSQPATKNVALCEKLFAVTCDMLNIEEFGKEL